MSLRVLLVALIVAGALGLAWHRREPLQAWLGASRAAAAAPATGDLRKCVKGGQVSYSNVGCPAGHQEQAVSGGTVTVVPATPLPRPADVAASGPSSLHKALDLTRDDTLREKAIERAVNGAAR